MLIAGIDPGRKNLGLCVYDTTRGRVVHWELLNVDDLSARTFAQSVRGVFVARDIGACQHVYIERQPPQNASMCRVQHYLQMYIELTYPACDVHIVQAAKRTRYLKANASQGPKKLLFDTYHQRKKSSVAFVDHLLSECETLCDDPIRSRFATATKRDDYAEAFLLSYIHALECPEEK